MMEPGKSLLEQVSLSDIPSILAKLSESEQHQLLVELERLQELKDKELAQERFLPFVERVWPSFIPGRHHSKMAAAFEEVANGTCKRLIINMPPRHTKSEFASYLLPAWFLGKFPNKKIIETAHTAELAVGFGRKVRNLVDSEAYKSIFPNVGLQSDSKAAGRWATNHGGDYFAIGVGGAVTGKGADILIIDDPHSEQEATIAQTNPEVYDKTYEWYTSGPRQRLQPGGAIVIVMCMVGNTDVLMGDGSTTKLKNIKQGDIVATYENGAISTSKVLNWKSNGVDAIYTVQTQSGIILQANERHPFLVSIEGKYQWTRLRDLKPGMQFVSTKVVTDQQDHKQNPDYAQPVKLVQATIEKTQTHPITPSGIMGNGRINNVVAENQSPLKDCVLPATQNNTPQKNQPLNRIELGVLNTVTESRVRSTTTWLKNATINAMFAGNLLLQKILGRTGTESSVSTTTILPVKLEGCCVTTVTSQLDTEKRLINCASPLSTYSVILDQIVSITPAGEAEVFDIEVERTENFIANGVVSHNTRWSKKDLTGQVLKSASARDGEEWKVIEFPAILPSGNPLWPEFWPLTQLEALKNELPVGKWQAQYQQQPTSDVNAIIKREWWQFWDEDEPPRCEFIIQSWDTAFLKTQRSDYSACTTWGVFYKEDDTGIPQANIILLNSLKKRMEFPELKQRAFEEWKEWEPDSLIVEAKASGTPLLFELRAMGIPVQEYTPSKGNDKIARLNAVSDLFASGRVWVPGTRWADELVEEVASFPSGEHDDLVDSTTQALLRFRRGGFIRLASDEPEDIKEFRRRKSAYY